MHLTTPFVHPLYGPFFWSYLRVGIGRLIEYWCEVFLDAHKVSALPWVVKKLLCWFVFAAQFRKIGCDDINHYFWQKTFDCSKFIWFQILLWGIINCIWVMHYRIDSNTPNNNEYSFEWLLDNPYRHRICKQYSQTIFVFKQWKMQTISQLFGIDISSKNTLESNKPNTI